MAKIIKCEKCLQQWHIKIPIRIMRECPNCTMDLLKAQNQRKQLKLRKVRSDKKTQIEHRKNTRERVAKWRKNKKNKIAIIKNL